MMTYNEYLIKQIENTNLEFERFMKNRNYTLTIVTLIVSVFTATTNKTTAYILVFVAIITLFYLLSILSIDFKIRYVDLECYYENKELLAEYLVECNTYISKCYNLMYSYTVLYILLVIFALLLNFVINLS